MRIRSFVEADRSAVLDLWHHADLVRPWNDPWADLDRSLDHPSSTVLVAEAREPGGQRGVVGTVMAGYDGHRGWLNLLAVAPGWRRRGVGAALVAAAEERLRAWGCPKVNLQIRAGNRAVVDFYRRLGYGVDDVVDMGRRLVSELAGVDRLLVMGDVWEPGEPRRTELGRLLAAEDHERLAGRLGEFAADHLAAPALVAAVPSDPQRARPLPARLAAAVAGAAGLAHEPDLVVRHRSTPRLRDTAPGDRPALVRAAHYGVSRPLDGDTVVLVDDVVLTGTTLAHLAELLVDAGAGSVIAVVAGRTRRA